MRYLVCLFLLLPLYADEGMWLYTNPPLKQIKERYGFEPSKDWLQHLQRSSVRFNNGGSGSFVSPDGLAMTNHHVAADCIAKLSTKQSDLVARGFLARSRSEERKCVDLELNQLLEIEDLTSRVNASVQSGMTSAVAQKARAATINNIEKDSLDKTGLRSDVVTLYNGGQYHLYRYKRYTDVRLVFAPEKAAAFFGGDPDNFEFPRYDMDVSFVRVYENNQPAKIADFFRWSAAGVKDGDLTFVSGHPGKTDRLDTLKHLEFLRDRLNPTSLNVLRRREVLLTNWSARSPENARRAEDELFGIQNSRKARTGMLGGLQDPAVIAKKRQDEEKLRAVVKGSEDLSRKYGSAWEEVSQALARSGEIYNRHYLLERRQAFDSDMLNTAFALVRYAGEIQKPNSQRLPEYSQSRQEPLKMQLLSDAPVYKDLETLKLADSLSMMVEWLGYDDPVAKQVLDGKSPQARADELVRGTSLQDVSVRTKLFEGGLQAVKASKDPMILLALAVEPEARKLRDRYDSEVDEPMKQAYGKIAQARFAAFGTSMYPDATFTLRLAYGQVKGYEEEGHQIPPLTSLGGAYAHAADHGNKDPFKLPSSWMEKKGSLNLNTPMNFVLTADIIGGNSGSPVVNKDAEIVGLIFDGNIYSLVLDYIFTETQSRALAVHSAGIIEVLNKIYGASNLTSELAGTRRDATQPQSGRERKAPRASGQ